MGSNLCTEVKNGLDGIAFMSGEGELILLGEIELSICLFGAPNKFDFPTYYSTENLTKGNL
jgi:hypothetical protein